MKQQQNHFKRQLIKAGWKVEEETNGSIFFSKPLNQKEKHNMTEASKKGESILNNIPRWWQFWRW
jgi:hypothetical protein